LSEQVSEHGGVRAVVAEPRAGLPLRAAGPVVRRGWQRQPVEGSSPVLPVLPELAGLLPHGGLRRGATVAVTRGSWLLLALLAAASRAGSWCGVVGWPEFGGVAPAELGATPERVGAGAQTGGQWAGATACQLCGGAIVRA